MSKYKKCKTCQYNYGHYLCQFCCGGTQYEPKQNKNTIILSVRIDYTTEKGENEQHALTAASLVINDHCPTIEEGVRIDHVEAYLDGEQVI